MQQVTEAVEAIPLSAQSVTGHLHVVPVLHVDLMINYIMLLLCNEHWPLPTAALKDSNDGACSQCYAQDGKGHKSPCVALSASQSINSTLQLPQHTHILEETTKKTAWGVKGLSFGHWDFIDFNFHFVGFYFSP